MSISLALVLEQTLNGLQYGVMLFLMAAGLTLVFGIMNLLNLAHGSLYMVGAYLATAFTEWTGSFVLGVALALREVTLFIAGLEYSAVLHHHADPAADQRAHSDAKAVAFRAEHVVERHHALVHLKHGGVRGRHAHFRGQILTGEAGGIGVDDERADAAFAYGNLKLGGGYGQAIGFAQQVLQINSDFGRKYFS